jgi:hypothetical protein
MALHRFGDPPDGEQQEAEGQEPGDEAALLLAVELRHQAFLSFSHRKLCKEQACPGVESARGFDGGPPPAYRLRPARKG